MLQLLDKRRLTDGKGRVVDFSNTIIILTSNIGSMLLSNLAPEKETDEVFNDVMHEVKTLFKPELINRLDKIILFRKLHYQHMKKIINIQINYLKNKLSKKKIDIILTKEAVDYLAIKGYDQKFGARPLKVLLQNPILILENLNLSQCSEFC